MGIDALIGFLPLFVVWAPFVYCTARILSRMGFNPWWSLLAFVPVANLIGLWRLSKINWPAVHAGSANR